MYGAGGRKSRTTPALPQAQRHRRDRKVPSLAESSLSIAQRASILLKTGRQDENMQKQPKMNGQLWYTTAMLAGYLRTAPMHTFSSPLGMGKAMCPALANGYGKAWVTLRPTQLRATQQPPSSVLSA